MYAAYLTATLLAATLTGAAAIANFVGHSYPKSEADRLKVPHSWMRPLGALLGAGATGLLAGLVAPPLGVLAAAGLVLYFVGALFAHLRAHDFQLAAWTLFFTASVAALVTNLSYH
ncbi:DoxX family protein [Kribbella turkmenica]|uniref:DoxX family protein n=1 Tax=Kribbella turkmenica TaxID=2530375 RepID=A0A4R4XG92_9ACTN|nr:DoxX family protein [Kribbella turkmenica]TDD29775.1 DoxX family protein [Kribbella turkmenica]